MVRYILAAKSLNICLNLFRLENTRAVFTFTFIQTNPIRSAQSKTGKISPQVFNFDPHSIDLNKLHTLTCYPVLIASFRS